VKPFQVATSLRQIAAKIDRSKSPSKSLVSQELRRVLAAVAHDPMDGNVHSSGDPETSGFSFTVSHPTTILGIKGKIRGQDVDGRLTIHIKDGEFNGYDYEPNGQTLDITTEDEILNTVLDAAASELGLS
jgi:hypothetical protein